MEKKKYKRVERDPWKEIRIVRKKMQGMLTDKLIYTAFPSANTTYRKLRIRNIKSK